MYISIGWCKNKIESATEKEDSHHTKAKFDPKKETQFSLIQKNTILGEVQEINPRTRILYKISYPFFLLF